MARFSQKDIFFKDGDMAVFGTDQDSRLYWDGVSDQLVLTTALSGVLPTLDSHFATKGYVDTKFGNEVYWDRSGTTIHPLTLTDNVSVGTTITGTASLNVYEQIYVHEFTGGTTQLVLDNSMTAEGGESYISFKDDGDIVGVFRAGISELEFTAYSNQNRDMIVQTGNESTGTNDTYLRTGDASGGDSGNVYIATGSAGGTKGGIYLLDTVYGDTVASGSLTLDSTSDAAKGLINVNSALNFDTGMSVPAHQEGVLYWDDTDHTLSIHMDSPNVSLQLGQETFVRARNNTGTTISNGKCVYITGAIGNRPTIALAKADSASTAKVLGVTTEAINNSADGYVNVRGKVRNVNTNAFSAGDSLYLSETTAGGFTNTPPTGDNFVVYIGEVLVKNPAEGQILVTGRSIEATNHVTLNNLRVFNDLDIQGNKIINVEAPTTYSGAANKGYVDSQVSSISGSDVTLNHLDGATYTTTQDFVNTVQSAGSLTDVTITDNGDGSISVGAGTGIIKSSDSDVGDNYFFNWDADANVVMASGVTNWVYVDYNGGSPIISSTGDLTNIDLHTQIVLCRAYLHIHSGSPALHTMDAGQYFQDFQAKTCYKDFELYRIQRASGEILSETGTRNISVTAGVLYCSHNRYTTEGFDSSGGDTFTYWYRDGAGGWTMVSGVSQIDNQNYDDGTGTLAALSNNNYGNHWVYRTHDGEVHVQYGQDGYNKLIDAEDASAPNPPTFLRDFAILIGRVIIEEGGTSFTDIASIFETRLQHLAAEVHNDLGELQGGTADQYYHLTSTQHSTLTSTGGVSDASTEHTHDGRYYTETEIDTISGSITSQISSGITTEYIELNPEPSNDDFSGTIVSSSVSSVTKFGQALYLDSDGTYKLTNATDSSAMPCVALSTVSGTGTNSILFQGFARNDAWNWTPGGPIFVDSTDGELTQTAVSGSGNVVQAVGFATHADRMFFNPDYTTVTVT